MKRTRNAKSEHAFVWINLKTTGSDPQKDHILEVACIITDKDLKYISPCFKASIYQTEESLDLAGVDKPPELIQECLESTLSLKNVESALLQFIQDRAEPGTCVLAGNYIEFDTSFLKAQMPSIPPILRRLTVDIASLRELCLKWHPKLHPPKRSQIHRALPDVKKNIEELQWYRHNLLVSPEKKRLITLSMPRMM